VKQFFFQFEYQAKNMSSSLTSDTVTEGIRVEATAWYRPDQSNPEGNRYLFSYRIRIANGGPAWVKLLSRHWIIINANGDRQDVQGPGVVGETPELDPGDVYDYTSFCPLDTEWGTMEGTYQMTRRDGTQFDIAIARFFLAVNAPQPVDVA
jgi:ApaG protein